ATASHKSACADACCTSTSATALGYSAEDQAAAPEAANLGLGCGNPLAIASLKQGQVVLDLGSGAGFDCFLAARAVGKSGKVIGVDMTHEMLGKARENAQKNGFTNVEFRLGEIEALPVADNSVDMIISNCVINLSPEKQRVFNEAFRVLKSGGRLAVADMVATASLPNEIKSDWAAYTGCIAGASEIVELEQMLGNSGFKDIKIAPKDSSRSFIREWLPGKRIEDYLISATIEAHVPFPDLNAIFVSTVEFVCGFLLVIGALTPLASVMLSYVMIMAIATSAIRNIKASCPVAWLAEFLYLPEPLYLVILIWLFFLGPGWLSVDLLVLL